MRRRRRDWRLEAADAARERLRRADDVLTEMGPEDDAAYYEWLAALAQFEALLVEARGDGREVLVPCK